MFEGKPITWVMAPMDGITDFRYRNAWWEVLGEKTDMKKAVAPFVTLVAGQVIKASHLEDIEPANNLMKVEPQILGNEIPYYGPMAMAMKDRGYVSLNWNLGCPMRQVASKGRGSGMLPYPEKIDAFLESAFSVSDMKVSVKIRLGYYDRKEIFPVMDVLNRYPLEYVAIHPRTGKQLYTGEADWDALEEILPLMKHPCVYSGDIDSVDKASAFVRRFPSIDQIMIGRKMVSDPFFVGELSGIQFEPVQKERLFACFVARLLHWYSVSGLVEKAVVQRQKLFWSRFSGDFVPKDAFSAIKNVSGIIEYIDICQSLFGGLWPDGTEQDC